MKDFDADEKVLTLVEQEFIRCIEDGFVTKKLIKSFYHTVPKSVFIKRLGNIESISTYSIPKRWCRMTAGGEDKGPQCTF